MAALTTSLLVGGLTLAGAGAFVSAKGAYDQQKAAKKSSKIAQREASLKQARDTRMAIRQMQIEQARQQALAGAQGMGFGSSGFLGSQFGAGSTSASNLLNINQGFDLARQSASANYQMAQAQTLGSVGAGLTNLGGTMMGNADTFGRVGQYFMGSPSTGAGPQNIIPPGYYGRA